MDKKVIKNKILVNGLLILASAMLCLDAMGSDIGMIDNDSSQYGFGLDSITLKSVDSRVLDFTKDFERDLTKSRSGQVAEAEAPVLRIDVEYQDKTADLFSPHHSFNTEIDHRLNNTSQEYKTRMGYRIGQLAPEAVLNYSPNSYGLGKYYNYELGLALPVKDIFSLETRYGWNHFDKKPEDGGIKDYQDWSIGVSTTYRGMKLKVDYIDIKASADSEECGQNFPCEGKTVFSIIKNF